jgi:CelD/BcsL family acetyltransferase involved in cellulose biosynthesis
MARPLYARHDPHADHADRPDHADHHDHHDHHDYAAEAADAQSAHDSARPILACLTRFTDLAALEAEWRALADDAAPLNPYASPDWTLPWLRYAVDERELAVLTVRRGARLVGVAPFYLREVGRVARSAQPAGTGRFGALTEMPQILAAPGDTRPVLRAVIGYWLENPETWDWLELPLTADQGWFEPQWLGEGRAVRGLVQHKTTRAAVVLALPGRDEGESDEQAPDTAPTLRRLIKRNVWESVKRARHRLDRAGQPWEIVVHTGSDGVRAALPELRRLHAARAEMAGARVHPDALADPVRLEFFSHAVTRMAAAGRAEVLTLDVDGVPVAAQLVLRSRSAAYFALSGMDPQWWTVGPVTLLQYTAMERALARGDAEVNLSVGPDISKLRWSEHVVQHPEFVVCGPRTRSRLLLSGYEAVAAVAAVHREAGRHRVRERGTAAGGGDT